MKSEHDILSKFANEIAERITRKCVVEFQKMKDTFSTGDSDSGLANAWDEICVQIQEQESLYWEDYDEMVRLFVASHVEELKLHEKLALWFQTEKSLDRQYEYVEKKGTYFSVDDVYIVQYVIQEYLYSKAAHWSNKRIRAFLEWH